MSLLTAARASFQATLASAGAPLTTYVSPLRRLLTLGRWTGLAVLLAWALSCFVALRSVDEATRVIGHDTAPSITAAERIRSLLSDANRNLALMTLLYEPDSGPFSSAFRADIADAEALLVEAAQNITYGDAEKTPITTIMQGLAEYERQVGRARMAGSGPAAIKAEGLMRNSILPATEELFERGIKLHRERPDKEWSLTDCISFVVMQDEQLIEALPADRHFEQAGFKPLLA